MKAVLRLRNYPRLLTVYALNELAWSVGSVALALLVYRRTGAPAAATAFFLALQFFPGLIAPALVARMDWRASRRVLLMLYAIQGCVFLVLAGASSRFSLVPVLLLVLFGGIVNLVARPIARATTASITAPAELLREANAVTNAAFAVSIMVGPIIGGVLVATGGAEPALLADCGVFAAISLTLMTAQGLPGALAERPSPAGRLRAAIGLAGRDVVVRRLLVFQSVALVFFSISIPVEVVFAQRSLHAGAGGYGVLLSAWGLGAIVGSAVYARWRALPGWLLITLSSVSMGGGFLLMSVAPTLVVATVGSVIGGLGNGIEAVAERTALQERVQQRWMALTMSLNESIFQVLPGAGILLGGAAAALAGPRVALAIGGFGALAAGVVAPVVLRAAGDVPLPAVDDHLPGPLPESGG